MRSREYEFEKDIEDQDDKNNKSYSSLTNINAHEIETNLSSRNQYYEDAHYDFEIVRFEC